MQKSKKMPLMIDVGTQLEVEVAGFDGRYKSHLVGIKPEEYLIVEAPPSNIARQLQEGTTTIIRYLYFGNIFGFKSKILRFISNPFSLLFLSYPDTVESHNLRKETRIQCHIPSTALIQNAEARGVIVDISVSGCQLVINMSKMDWFKSVKLEEDIKLSFPFFGMEELLTVSATILHVNNDNGNMFLGLKFKDLGKETLQTIETYIANVSDQIP